MLKISCKCPDCSTENSMLTLQDTRLELKMEKGDSIPVRCKKCGQNHSCHVNDFAARNSDWMGIVLIILVLAEITRVIIGLLNWQMSRFTVIVSVFVATALPIAHAALIKANRRKVSSFNHHKA
jgi:hypothetical protein